MSNTAGNYLRSLAVVLFFTASLARAEDATTTALPPDAAADLLYRLETLQSEVQKLRGVVEEQQHEIAKMKASQKDRYIDLDKRISLVMSQMSEIVANQGSMQTQAATIETDPTDDDSVVASSALSSTLSTTAGVTQTTTGPVTIQPTTPEIQAAYKASYDLIRSKEYDKAADAFTKFINNYPNTDLTGNAYYWLGQLKLVLGDPKNALEQFSTVVNKFPGHNKEPDAIYKLGLVNDQLDNKIAAKRYLIDVIERFPVSDAAKLAKKYLSSMK